MLHPSSGIPRGLTHLTRKSNIFIQLPLKKKNLIRNVRESDFRWDVVYMSAVLVAHTSLQRPFKAVHVSSPERTVGCKRRVKSIGRVKDGMKAIVFQSKRFCGRTSDVPTAAGRIDTSAFCAAGNAANRFWQSHLSNLEASDMEFLTWPGVEILKPWNESCPSFFCCPCSSQYLIGFNVAGQH